MLKKMASLVDVLGVIALGWLLTKVVVTLLGFPDLNEALDLLIVDINESMTDFSLLASMVLSIQFLCLILPATLLCKWLYKWNFRMFLKNEHSHPKQNKVMISIILFCFFGIFMKVFLIANHLLKFDAQPNSWGIFNREWNFEFWIFMAVGSYILVPIYEEIFYRGFVFKRLQKDFKNMAILITSLLFTVVHIQYLSINIFNFYMLISLFLLALAMTFSVHLTGSVLPAILIHCFMNIPIAFIYDIVVLLVMLIVLLINRIKLLELLEVFFSLFRNSAIRKHAIYFFIVLIFAAGMVYFAEITLILFILLMIFSVVLQKRSVTNTV